MKLPTLEDILENKKCERIVSLVGLIFPFLEVHVVLGPKVLCNTNNADFNIFFKTHLVGPIAELYSNQANHMISFIIMVIVFDACVRKTIPLTLFSEVLNSQSNLSGRNKDETFQSFEFLTLEQYLQEYFGQILRKLKEVNYQQTQRNNDISFL